MANVHVDGPVRSSDALWVLMKHLAQTHGLPLTDADLRAAYGDLDAAEAGGPMLARDKAAAVSRVIDRWIDRHAGQVDQY